eukprot:scaffold421308_cov64-Attheya_sp.AAC.4
MADGASIAQHINHFPSNSLARIRRGTSNGSLDDGASIERYCVNLKQSCGVLLCANHDYLSLPL